MYHAVVLFMQDDALAIKGKKKNGQNVLYLFDINLQMKLTENYQNSRKILKNKKIILPSGGTVRS